MTVPDPRTGERHRGRDRRLRPPALARHSVFGYHDPMSLEYRPATEEDLTALRAKGFPIPADADPARYSVPVDPERIERMRSEMLTMFAPATEMPPGRRVPVRRRTLDAGDTSSSS